MGKRKRHAKQASMWVATQDLPRSAAHPLYTRLNQVLDEHDFGKYVDELSQGFYSDEGNRAPRGRYFRLLLIGYFEGLESALAAAPRDLRSPPSVVTLRQFVSECFGSQSWQGLNLLGW